MDANVERWPHRRRCVRNAVIQSVAVHRVQDGLEPFALKGIWIPAQASERTSQLFPRRRNQTLFDTLRRDSTAHSVSEENVERGVPAQTERLSVCSAVDNAISSLTVLGLIEEQQTIGFTQCAVDGGEHASIEALVRAD